MILAVAVPPGPMALNYYGRNIPYGKNTFRHAVRSPWNPSPQHFAAPSFFPNMIATQPLPPPGVQSQNVSPLTNPNLSAALRLEYDALVHDVRRAHELCADFQRQLVGKSHEADEFKELFAKTQHDLFQLQDSIIQLREERHRLANEAMRATALSRKLVEITTERDRLLVELESSKKGDGRSASESNATNGKDEGVKIVLSDMWRTLERLQTILDPNDAPHHASPAGANPVALTNGRALADNARS